MNRKIITAMAFVIMTGCAQSHRDGDVSASPQEDSVSVPFEQIAKLAREAGSTPVPLKSGPNPGTLREGKPWSGAFVCSSHKTEAVVEEYKHGQRDGLSVGYHSENIKHWEGRYVKGVKDGVFRVWDAAGQLMSTETFRMGVRIDQDN